MKAKELRQKNTADIIKIATERQVELREMLFGVAGSKAKNVKLVKSIRKDIARMLTVMNENRVKAK